MYLRLWSHRQLSEQFHWIPTSGCGADFCWLKLNIIGLVDLVELTSPNYGYVRTLIKGKGHLKNAKKKCLTLSFKIEWIKLLLSLSKSTLQMEEISKWKCKEACLIRESRNNSLFTLSADPDKET